MSDDIVVVDNGSTYETQESAIVAKKEADRAEQWAKYSEKKANLADERAVDAAESSDAAAQAATAAIEAKQYAETAVTDKNLIVVATDLKSTPSNIKTVAGSIGNVNTVGKNINNVNAVAANKTHIDAVAASKANIDKVATNIVNVNTVAKNIDNVNLLAPHTGAMEALAPDIMDVVTVAGITEQTKNVSENMAHVVAVDNNKANIDKAVANATNITTVATSINNVNAVAGNKANIDNVASNKTNINNVSVNMPAVKDVSKNMADVKKAIQSANDAKLWAVGTITEKPEGSSKYWAEQAQQTSQVYDASETVKGIVRLATSKEAKAGLNDTTAITPLKLKQNIVDNVGRINQLGFNGVLQSGVITFTPDQGTYELKVGYEYEIDLLFSAVGIIPDNTQLKIVNGTNTINIVNVLDSDYSKPTTYKAMKQVCRYDTEIGWRWIFNVRYSVASDGSKVFVMPATSINLSSSIAQDLTKPSADTVPSTKAVSDESSRKVSKTGDTMSGTLTNNGVFVSQFDAVNYMARSKTLIKGTTPANDKYVGYDWQDSRGERLVYMGVSYKANGVKVLELQKIDSNLSGFNIYYDISVSSLTTFNGGNSINISRGNNNYAEIQTHKKNGTRTGGFRNITYDTEKNECTMYVATDDGTSIASDIAIGKTNDGKFYTRCPKSILNNSIVTTIAHSTNYVRLGNGLQICWGAGTGVQVFPQPFKDTDYMIADSDLTYHKYEGMWTSDKTTTQFKINNSSNAQWIAIGYWY